MTQLERTTQTIQDVLKKTNRSLRSPKISSDMAETILALQLERETDPHRVYNYSPKDKAAK